MAEKPAIFLDVLIFGGGVAGLWLLDEVGRAGYSALLIEANALGQGQSVASQGIIHGGLKYMFDGRLTPAASAIVEMPVIWRSCLAGQREPDLSGTKILSDACYIWGTRSIKSKIFMIGSTLALRAAPRTLERSEWPAALANVPGKVLRVPEQVIDPASLMGRFLKRNAGRVLLVGQIPEFRADGTTVLREGGREIMLSADRVIFSAGEGNAELRQRAGLPAGAMQIRPLHMVMARGKLPSLFGHCVGGPKPRITVTSATDSSGRTVWQIGGLIAENGVARGESELVRFASEELPACIPGLDLAGVEFATYRVNRAEAVNPKGDRPDDVHLLEEGRFLTAWPTKLALAPRLAERVLSRLPAAHHPTTEALSWPAPPVAPLPWEREVTWHRVG